MPYSSSFSPTDIFLPLGSLAPPLSFTPLQPRAKKETKIKTLKNYTMAPRKPSPQWPKCFLIPIRILQLISAIVIIGITAFFTYHLVKEDIGIPYELIALDVIVPPPSPLYPPLANHHLLPPSIGLHNNSKYPPNLPPPLLPLPLTSTSPNNRCLPRPPLGPRVHFPGTRHGGYNSGKVLVGKLWRLHHRLPPLQDPSRVLGARLDIPFAQLLARAQC